MDTCAVCSRPAEVAAVGRFVAGPEARIPSKDFPLRLCREHAELLKHRTLAIEVPEDEN